MKLVNTYKLAILFLLIGLQSAKAQVWTIDQCIDTAKVHNKNLQMKWNNIAVSEQKQKEAKANLRPKVTANADYRYFTDLPYQLMPMSVFGGQEGEFKEAQFGVPHNINANVQVIMPLYNPQIYGAIETANIGIEINELQYQKTEEQLFFEISNLYYNAQILQKQLDFIDSSLINTGKLLKTMQLMHEQLLAKGTDVSKIKLQADQLRTQRNLIQNKGAQVLNKLKTAMGITLDSDLQIEKEISYHHPHDYPRESSLEFLIAKKHNELTGSELRTLKMTRLPSITLFGTYGTTGFGYDQSPDRFLKFYPIGYAGIQLSYPLFNGRITQRKINQKDLEMANHALQVKLVDEQNTMQVENAKLQRQTTLYSIKTLEQQITLATLVYHQTVVQQKQGTASLTEVLMADNAVREAQQSYITAVVDFLKADLELKKLTGNFLNKK